MKEQRINISFNEMKQEIRNVENNQRIKLKIGITS